MATYKMAATLCSAFNLPYFRVSDGVLSYFDENATVVLPPPHKIKELLHRTCENCKETYTTRNTFHGRQNNSRFCSKSCAASARNRKRWATPGYREKVSKSVSKRQTANWKDPSKFTSRRNRSYN